MCCVGLLPCLGTVSSVETLSWKLVWYNETYEVDEIQLKPKLTTFETRLQGGIKTIISALILKAAVSNPRLPPGEMPSMKP